LLGIGGPVPIPPCPLSVRSFPPKNGFQVSRGIRFIFQVRFVLCPHRDRFWPGASRRFHEACVESLGLERLKKSRVPISGYRVFACFFFLLPSISPLYLGFRLRLHGPLLGFTLCSTHTHHSFTLSISLSFIFYAASIPRGFFVAFLLCFFFLLLVSCLLSIKGFSYLGF